MCLPMLFGANPLSVLVKFCRITTFVYWKVVVIVWFISFAPDHLYLHVMLHFYKMLSLAYQNQI